MFLLLKLSPQGDTVISVVGGDMGGANLDSLVRRLMSGTSKLRLHDARYLLYALLDTMVDEVLMLTLTSPTPYHTWSNDP